MGFLRIAEKLSIGLNTPVEDSPYIKIHVFLKKEINIMMRKWSSYPGAD